MSSRRPLRRLLPVLGKLVAIDVEATGGAT